MKAKNTVRQFNKLVLLMKLTKDKLDVNYIRPLDYCPKCGCRSFLVSQDGHTLICESCGPMLIDQSTKKPRFKQIFIAHSLRDLYLTH